jgi:hypothetical protein
MRHENDLQCRRIGVQIEWTMTRRDDGNHCSIEGEPIHSIKYNGKVSSACREGIENFPFVLPEQIMSACQLMQCSVPHAKIQ